MNSHNRLVGPALLLLLVVLVGCSGAFGIAIETNPVDDTSVQTMLQYRDGRNTGPEYAVNLTVPDAWVGEFEAKTEGNKLVFERIKEIGADTVTLTIEALSQSQYWKQVGSYPGDFTNILFTADTYFIYHVPPFASYLDLSGEEYTAFRAEIADIVQTLTVERAG